MVDILLSKCAQFREQEEFIDVRLQVGEKVFSAHRMVLAANSDYFYAMFTNGMKESIQEVIELKDESISADVLKIVLESIYSGGLRVNEENVFDVLDTANHLQITNVVRQCCDFLTTHFVQDGFDLQRYCQLSAVADRHGLEDLQESVECKTASMYNVICDNEEFLSQINLDQLLSLLRRDDLSAPSETFVFKSVMRWINHKKEERLPVAAKVIEAVRLGLVDIGVLIEELNTEEIQRVPEIHKILIDASLYFHSPSQISKFAETTKPRAASTVSELTCGSPFRRSPVLFLFSSSLGKIIGSQLIIIIIIIIVINRIKESTGQVQYNSCCTIIFFCNVHFLSKNRKS